MYIEGFFVFGFSSSKTPLSKSLFELILSASDVDGDELTLFKISDVVQNTVSINGPLNRPGIFQYEKNMTINDLIVKADGLLSDAYMKRANLIRLNNDGSESFINIDLNEAFVSDNEKFILFPNDSIQIFSLSEKLFKTDLSITGHVLNPGIKPFRENMKIEDLKPANQIFYF